MLKASFSSFEFYAKKFVEYGLRKALSSSFEFYAKQKGPKMETSCVALWVGDEVSLLTKKQASASGRF